MNAQTKPHKVQCQRCKKIFTENITERCARSGGFGFPQMFHSQCLSAVATERQQALENKNGREQQDSVD